MKPILFRIFAACTILAAFISPLAADGIQNYRTSQDISQLTGAAISTDLYVDTTGSDSTNSGLSAATPFATLGNAFSYIGARTGVKDWAVHVKAGHYSTSTPANAYFRSSRVNVTGDYSTTTSTAVSIGSGAAGAWPVTYTFASASAASVGDWIIVRNVVGTGHYKSLEGLWKITGKSSNDVTVNHTGQFAAFPTAALTSADVVILRTVLNFTGVDGIRASGSLLIDGVAIVGDKTADTAGILTDRQAISQDDQVSVGAASQHIGIAEFNVCALAQYGNSIDLQYGAVSDCLVYGALGQHTGSVFFNNGIANGNVEEGIAATDGGNISAENANASANGTFGFWAYDNGSILGKGASAWDNVDGVRVSYGGSVRLGTSAGFTANYNSEAGLYVVLADLYSEGNTYTGNNVGIIVTDRGRAYIKSSTFASSTVHDISTAHQGFVESQSGVLANVLSASGGRVNLDSVTGLTSVTPALNRQLSDGTLNYDSTFSTNKYPDAWTTPTGLYLSTFPGSVGTATAIGAADTLYVYPFELKFPVSAVSINLRVVTGGAGSSWKGGIYATCISSNKPRPCGAPLAVNNTGAATSSSSSTSTLTFTSVTFQPGEYWAAEKFTGTMPVVDHIATTSWVINTLLGRTNLSTTALQGLSLADTYTNNLPTLDGTEGWAEVTTGAIGVVHLGT